MPFGTYTREEALECVGNGWASLINHLYDIKPEDVEVEQVKEKFGGLRFYISAASQEYNDEVIKAENDSYQICEVCGNPGSLREPAPQRYWIKTLCDVHAEGRKPLDD